MALPENRIGQFDFIRFQATGGRGGIPRSEAQRVATTQRPGVNGTGVILLGVKGVPFEVETVRDVNTYTDGLQLADDYRGLVGEGAYAAVQNGVDLAAEWSVNYAVLEIAAATVRKMSAASGGLSSLGGAVLTATWILLPVSIDA